MATRKKRDIKDNASIAFWLIGRRTFERLLVGVNDCKNRFRAYFYRNTNRNDARLLSNKLLEVFHGLSKYVSKPMVRVNGL